MKEIGLSLKAKREENGVTVEEAAEDLKLRPSQIRSIEEGKIEDFKDVFYLKYFIRDYAKYLGLDSEKILDELIKYAIYNLKKAKSNHDVIENYYIPNMNFEKVDELKNQLIERILKYED